MQKFKQLIVFAATLVLSFTAYAQVDTTVIQQQTIKPAGIWIDVRSSDEFNQGHLENAVNISHTEIASQISQLNLNKDASIHVYCRSGRRSEIALNTLKALGYTNVTNQGGYEELIKKGIK